MGWQAHRLQHPRINEKAFICNRFMHKPPNSFFFIRTYPLLKKQLCFELGSKTA